MRETRRVQAGRDTKNSNAGMDGIMNETEFLDLAHGVLDTIESHVDEWEGRQDVDVEAVFSGNVLTLTFEDGTQVVVNSQAAMQEIWVAARSGGVHSRYDGQRWKDTRGGPDLDDALSQICSEAAGQVLTVRL